MSLTLADIDRWSAVSVREVFHAATDRARATADVSRELSTLSVFDSWEGKSADAARHAVASTRQDLDSHGKEAATVAAAASKAAEGIEKVQADLAKVRELAASHGLEIDSVTGTVAPAAGAFGHHGRREMQEWIPRIVSMLTTVLTEADEVDAELAAAINMADGDTPIAPAPNGALPDLPPVNATPEEVLRWWNSLTPEQQAAEIASRSVELGKMDGIPPALRQQLNRQNLPEELRKARERVAQLTTIAKFDPGRIAERDAAVNKLKDLVHLTKLLEDKNIGLLLLDTTGNPNTVLAALAFGDVDNAEQVGVTVGGMGTSVRASVESMTSEVKAQRDKAIELRRNSRNFINPDAVATIAYLGYEAPGLSSVASDELAKTGADSLNRFYKGLAATTNVADQQITAFGHSYGSLTTSLALQQGAPVDNVVLYGSPGGGEQLTNASQLGVAPGRAYFIDGINDGVSGLIPEARHIPIQWTTPGLLLGWDAPGFGPPIRDIPGFTELSAYSGQAPGGTVGDGQWHERAYGHSEYPRSGDNGQLRTSAYNMAAVLAGLPYEALPAPTDLPPPFKIGGRIVVPNPDYHP